jgi:hypothetical protein
MNIEMDKANSDPNIPQLSVDNDVDVNIDNNDNCDVDEDGDGDVDGPTVEAYIDLAKTACKYCRT